MTPPRDILFLSHGAPSLLTGRSQARRYLEGLGPVLSGARAVAAVSAHWESRPVKVTTAARSRTVHDFRGFGDALARFQWPAPGAPDLAHALADGLRQEGVEAAGDPGRGFDHGVWVPLALALPAAQTPVIQVSLPARDEDDAAARRLGAALGGLAARLDLQLVFSGALTHSLHDALAAPEAAPAADFARAFNDWAAERLRRGDMEGLARWRAAPQARRNHPTPEHLRPLLAAQAAAGGAPGVRRHASFTHAALAMDVWSFPGRSKTARSSERSAA